MLKRILIHPALILVTLPVALMLWSLGGFLILGIITSNWCAVAFSYWTILLFLNLLKIKVPQIAFLLGAIAFAFLGTLTLIVYRPFFSPPTLVHLLEAIIGYGYLISLLLDKNLSRR
jgi:hypothetical protein